MTFDLDALGLHPVRIPMRHRFRQVDHRDAVLIEGPAGWGEFSPFPEYPAEVAALRWASRDELRADMRARPDAYAPWLAGVLTQLDHARDVDAIVGLRG